MKPFAFAFIISLFSLTISAQPVSNDPSVTVTQLMHIEQNAVRIAKCKYDDHLYYITFRGDIYKLSEDSGLWTDSLVATEADHGMNYLQGIVFYDNVMYVVGNNKTSGAAGLGICAKAIMSGNALLWSNIFSTEPYPSTATLYDHAFSGICITDNGDSLYICSGSRTDHGEIQSANGLFPDTREVALTSLILKIPVTLADYTLKNDSAFLDSTGFVFAKGVRNNFDLAFNRHNDLIGVENSGDRDDSDELNWLQQGMHYGFPWTMGGNATGQQFASYDASSDLLINPNSLAATLNYFYNDTTYPPPPSGIVFAEPVKNYGPYADKYRSSADGNIYDASDNSTYISTLTTHRSPLGIVFDRNEILDGIYNGDGFMLCYTPGCPDSSGYIPGLGLGPFLEPGQELLHLEFTKDSSGYSVNIFPLITGFVTPVDAEFDSNILYVIEHRVINDTVPPNLWRVQFPVIVSAETNERNDEFVYPNPCVNTVYVSSSYPVGRCSIYSIAGNLIAETESGGSRNAVDVSMLEAGLYILTTGTGTNECRHKIVVGRP